MTFFNDLLTMLTLTLTLNIDDISNRIYMYDLCFSLSHDHWGGKVKSSIVLSLSCIKWLSWALSCIMWLSWATLCVLVCEPGPVHVWPLLEVWRVSLPMVGPTAGYSGLAVWHLLSCCVSHILGPCRQEADPWVEGWLSSHPAAMLHRLLALSLSLRLFVFVDGHCSWSLVAASFRTLFARVICSLFDCPSPLSQLPVSLVGWITLNRYIDLVMFLWVHIDLLTRETTVTDGWFSRLQLSTDHRGTVWNRHPSWWGPTGAIHACCVPSFFSSLLSLLSAPCLSVSPVSSPTCSKTLYHKSSFCLWDYRHGACGRQTSEVIQLVLSMLVQVHSHSSDALWWVESEF